MKPEFIKITSHESMPISILSLYLLAFPADERRPCHHLFHLSTVASLLSISV